MTYAFSCHELQRIVGMDNLCPSVWGESKWTSTSKRVPYIDNAHFFKLTICLFQPNWHISIFGQTTCPKIIRMCTYGNHNIEQQQKQNPNNHNFKCLYFMFIEHHICVIWDLVHLVLMVGFVYKSCINPNVFRS